MSGRINQRKGMPVPENSSGGIFYILKGLIISLIFSALILIVFAIFCTFFYPTDEAVTGSAFLACFLGALFSGIYTTKHTLKNGLLNGGISGLLYAFVVILTGAVIGGNLKFDLSFWRIVLLSLLGGATGGIFGINTGRNKR